MTDPLDWLDEALVDLDRRGLRRTLENRFGSQSNRIQVKAQTLINFGSNDYLGLANDPAVGGAAQQATQEAGWGAGASPLVCGREFAHFELERSLADFEKTEAAMLFPTGFAANVGAITSLVGKGDVIYSDQLNHASIIDGCRLSGAAIHVYRHADVDELRRRMREGSRFRRRLIVSESLFSMGGDFAPLANLSSLAAEFGAILMVDEAHATGVFGRRGSGVCEEVGVEGHVQIRVSTLSKALGGIGGFVAGSQRLIDWLANRARTLIYSTSAPAAVAAAAQNALQIVSYEPQRREMLRLRAQDLRKCLIRRGFDVGKSESQIIPLVLGDPLRTLAAADELRQMAFFVPAMRPPSVPEGQSLLRISLTYSHTEEQINHLVAALSAVLK